MNINITTITKVIAALPELVLDTVSMARYNYDLTLERINDTVEDGFEAMLRDVMAAGEEGCDNPDHDHSQDDVPLSIWEAGRRGLEFTMLIRSHREFDADFHRIMSDAAPEVDSPQHAMDVIMALASMLNHLAEDEDLAMFAQATLDAEVSAQ